MLRALGLMAERPPCLLPCYVLPAPSLHPARQLQLFPTSSKPLAGRTNHVCKSNYLVTPSLLCLRWPPDARGARQKLADGRALTKLRWGWPRPLPWTQRPAWIPRSPSFAYWTINLHLKINPWGIPVLPARHPQAPKLHRTASSKGVGSKPSLCCDLAQRLHAKAPEYLSQDSLHELGQAAGTTDMIGIGQNWAKISPHKSVHHSITQNS